MTTLWFILVAVLWTGFMVLEGFDFGVGMLHGMVGRDEVGRRVAIGTIAPVWDGNEVWLIVAAASMFAAFPGWYATLFSGFYLALVLMLVGLILRGVTFEFRDKRDSARWRRGWDAALLFGSAVTPMLIGIALSDLLYGLPIDADQEYVGGFVDLINAYSVLGGVTFVLMCLLHGATFLALKTTGDVRERALLVARRVGGLAVIAVVAFVIWTHVLAKMGLLFTIVELIAIMAVLAALWLVTERRDLWAFAATSTTIAAVVVAIFAALYPRVMVSSLSAANDLTVSNTASAPYSLKVMTVVAVILLPGVLVYQAWSYHVFRKRVSREDVQEYGASAAVEP
jgi:cytochrome d ubiquinol oxidase subunit II